MPRWPIVGKNIGLASEYPYTASNGTCHKVTPAYWINNVNIIQVTSTSAVKSQPIAVGFDGKTQQFQLYKSGILYPNGCTSDWNNNALVVGYGFASGKTIFKIKNSWGTR